MPEGSIRRCMIRRLIQLYLGLIAYGLSLALMVRADLGLDPWDVFHQGLAQHSALSFGMIVNAVGVLVLLLWIPLREKPGIGTISNVIVIGTVADICLALLPPMSSLPLRLSMLVFAIILNGAASGAYIGAGLGPGPRDGLMTGLVKRTGWAVRWVRGGIEAIVLAGGWLLGGTVGLGTVVYALAIGPLIQFFLPILTVGKGASSSSRNAADQAACPDNTPRRFCSCATCEDRE